MNLNPDEQAWLDEYRQTLAKDYPGLVDDILIFGSKARGDAGPDSDLDVLVVLNQGRPPDQARGPAQWSSVVGPVGRDAVDHGVHEGRMAGARELHVALLPNSHARCGACGMNRRAVVAEWRRATESMGAARSCLRDGYYADSVSLAYYAILHAAKASLQLHGVMAESHTGVRAMFGLHIVRTGLVEREWAAALADSADERTVSDYDAETQFDEQDAREACERADAFLDRIRPLLTSSIPPEDLD